MILSSIFKTFLAICLWSNGKYISLDLLLCYYIFMTVNCWYVLCVLTIPHPPLSLFPFLPIPYPISTPTTQLAQFTFRWAKKPIEKKKPDLDLTLEETEKKRPHFGTWDKVFVTEETSTTFLRAATSHNFDLQRGITYDTTMESRKLKTRGRNLKREKTMDDLERDLGSPKNA